jgi:hypothetical protein
MNIYQKLNYARDDFHKTKLKKTGHNKFANYYYFELGDFLIPALQIFKEHGLTSVITFGTEVAHMTIVDNDKPEDRIIITSPMCICMYTHGGTGGTPNLYIHIV